MPTTKPDRPPLDMGGHRLVFYPLAHADQWFVATWRRSDGAHVKEHWLGRDAYDQLRPSLPLWPEPTPGKAPGGLVDCGPGS